MQAVKAARYVWQYGGTAVTYYHLPDCDYGKIIYQRCDENAEKRKQNGACRKAGLRFVPGTFGRQTEKKAGRGTVGGRISCQTAGRKVKKDTGKRRKSTGAHE